MCLVPFKPLDYLNGAYVMTTGNKNTCNFEKRGLTARYTLTPSPALCSNFRTHAPNHITQVNGQPCNLSVAKIALFCSDKNRTLQLPWKRLLLTRKSSVKAKVGCFQYYTNIVLAFLNLLIAVLPKEFELNPPLGEDKLFIDSGNYWCISYVNRK